MAFSDETKDRVNAAIGTPPSYPARSLSYSNLNISHRHPLACRYDHLLASVAALSTSRTNELSMRGNVAVWHPPPTRPHHPSSTSSTIPQPLPLLLTRLTIANVQTVITVGWIPFIIFVGYRNSSPQPSLIKLITPLA
ncbi:uncharacterized protein LOC62_01G000790 [Vanrija pseudolonga]|uniref:Mitochondrial import receptor subunit TOM7 n=1 Tax=Vanrija pseudolonga TaxID=143232 RepID=A0AAF1BFC0_9TREE|nr:hypothetical protein LOC62_01G000790 [Vanrija pseudolonga]